MKKIKRNAVFTAVPVIIGLSVLFVATSLPTSAEGSVWQRLQIKRLQLVGKKAHIQQKGSKPVRIKDNLRVAGNITLKEGKTVDGIDVGSIVSMPVGCAENQLAVFDGTDWQCADSTLTLGADAVGANELSSSAIEPGDIDVTDLPSLSSANLSNASAVAMLDEGEVITGNWVNTAHPWADNEVDNALTISGGSVEDTPIGVTTASTGNFSNVTLNGVAPVLPALRSVPGTNTITTVDSSTDDTGSGPSITIGTDGMPVISYVDVANRDLKVAHCLDTACTEATISTPSDDARLFTSVAIGADGYPVIVYDRMSSDGVMVLHCGSIDCSSGNTSTEIAATSTGIPSITIGTDGYPVLAYVTSSTLKIADCANATCSSDTTITDIDADSVSTYPVSIAVAPDTYPVVSYYHSSGGDLRVAKCTTTTCSASGTQDLDTTNNVGRYSSLVIGMDGFPVVSYYDETNANLMVAKCGDTNCTNGAATITTLDSTGTVGRGPSITVGPTGYPIIAYTDETNGYIKLINCTTMTCASGNVITSPVNLNHTSFSFVHFTPMTIGRNNLPIIAYYTQNNLDLGVASLANQYGIDNFVRR